MALPSTFLPTADMPVDILSGARNPRGIPQMSFFEDIATFLASKRAAVDGALQSLQTMHSKFKLMEGALLEQRKRCRAQVPDLEASLAALLMLAQQRDRLAADGDPETFTTFFNLSEQVFAQASVAPAGHCAVWLGANVMLEYSYAEAEEMLAANLAAARRKAVETEEDLFFLKDQLTTTEVNM